MSEDDWRKLALEDLKKMKKVLEKHDPRNPIPHRKFRITKRLHDFIFRK